MSVNRPMSGSASTPAENAAPDRYMAEKPISSINRPTSAFGAPGTWIAVDRSRHAASRRGSEMIPPWHRAARGMRQEPSRADARLRFSMIRGVGKRQQGVWSMPNPSGPAAANPIRLAEVSRRPRVTPTMTDATTVDRRLQPPPAAAAGPATGRSAAHRAGVFRRWRATRRRT